ncbi:DUF92 domain-containing protein [Enterococcus casseliflavus]|uniref:DUF92 domain-containing protein n=1 Tax=Enterococcus TaxID=1350 RepID=UPI001CA937AD|nr:MULTISPECIES: DUF92 domain-containing protein [Enterococcus]MBZ0324351.1 DUF92 domain-containing protein [Enterococcus casseliflavus]
MVFFYQFMLGLFASTFVAAAAFIFQWLTISGALAAILCGTLVIGFGPWYSIFLIGFFFASSGIIGLLKKMRSQPELAVLAKGARRDAKQVFANIAPSIFALLLAFWTKEPLFLWGFVAGIASCTADTWGSEIGVLSPSAPRHLLTGKKLPPGLSGGVSWLGTAASLAGSLAITGLFATALWLNGKPFSFDLWLTLTVLGFCGSLLDSLLGATIQVRYQCPVCHQYTEKKVHHDVATKQVGGLSFVTNEGVNLLTSIVIVILTVCFFYLKMSNAS